MPNRYRILLLVLIIAIAIFFRFWQFDSIPPGLYQDEAMNGADALAMLKSSDFKIFYTNNNGREGMIVWLDALAIKLFGTEPWVLRIFPALAGVLAVLGLYFLAKELFGIEVALASSFFMAVSFWAVNFSRMGFRAGLMLPFLIWSFYFLIRGLTEVRSLGLIIAAGILFGLGFYTYISYRFTPLLALFAFGPILFKKGGKKLWPEILIFIAVAFLVTLPIGLYFLNNPQDFFGGRTSQVSIFSADNPFKAAAISIASTLGMFNIVGDFNWRHNFSGSPQLFWPIGILFLLGILMCIKKHGFSDKFLLLWFFVFLLPNILTAESNPHALRSLGAMPAAMIFAGIGLIWVYEKIRIKKQAFLLLVVFLSFVIFAEFNKYFIKWASNIKTAEVFSQNQIIISDYLNKLPKNVTKYVIWSADDRSTDNGLPVSAQTVYFLTSEKTEINYLKSNELDKIKIGKNGTIIIPIYFDLDLLHYLNNQFLNSKVEVIGLNAGAVTVP